MNKLFLVNTFSNNLFYIVANFEQYVIILYKR
nr:MAG TPA: hypothetical protein [Caudoviricetes sp.]DAY84930.1 MAG TPA: hypothetical protein [Caudoviricetes sp.]